MTSSDRPTARFTAAWVIVLLVGASWWWGIHPPRSADGYREESSSTVSALRSQVVTARMWLDQVAHDRVTTPAAQVALVETETDASDRLSSYSSLQPPERALIPTRTIVIDVGDRVVAALGAARIAARAGRWDEAVDLRERLEALARELDATQHEVAP